MALFKKQEKKNEKEEKNLQTGKNENKASLDDDLLAAVSGGCGAPSGGGDEKPGGEHVLGTGKF